MSKKPLSYDHFLKSIETKQFSLGIVGLGYVGLPLVCEFVENDISVIGFEISETKIKQLENGIVKNYLDNKHLISMPYIVENKALKF